MFTLCLSTFLILGFLGVPFFLWALAILAVEYFSFPDLRILIPSLALIAVLLIPMIRRHLVSRMLMTFMKKLKLVPSVSATEKEAIAAGSTWVEKEFFRGNPNLKILLSQPLPTLTTEESAFLDHQVEILCEMTDDWEIWRTRTLPPKIWDYIKREKFLGLVIEKKYGGLGFSSFAHSEIIKKLASRSFVVAIYVMVPNSLGPGELIHRYGTREQKNEFLPRLANGLEIPCFGLTELNAGSDAGNVRAEGVLFKRGDETAIRLNWDKRYISLAKISTLIGLAFQLKDPDHILSAKTDLGITCALIPSNESGVTISDRHDPLGVPFYNCPMVGRNVEIPLTAVVGGKDGVGQGWKMLMECLAEGRGISFPAQMAGSSQIVARTVVSYAQVREQFGVSISQFEGIKKPLSEVIAFTYLIESLRKYTLSALDQGLKPATIASISKYYSTEYSRKLINHSMDILGGSGISMGPRNKVAPYYIAAPISITVEGANILTRTLMIFGQGAFRAHPFAFPMIDSLEKNDLTNFDLSFFGLVGHGIQNFCRSILLSLTRGWLAHPFSYKRQSVYYRRISWASASFAFMTDVAMGSLGGKLKFKEALTGRFADILSNLYMASAVLRKYESEGERAEDWAVAEYALNYLFDDTEKAFQGIYANLPAFGLRFLFKYPVNFYSKLNPLAFSVDDSKVDRLIARVYEEPSFLKNMTHGIFIPKSPDDHFVKLEAAAKIQRLIKPFLKELKELEPLLTKKQMIDLKLWKEAQSEVLKVDEFSDEEYLSRIPKSDSPGINFAVIGSDTGQNRHS